MFYLLLMQWIPFWGSDWTLSMGIFITEGGGNWGWRETVGRADKHHQCSSVGFLAGMENTCIPSVKSPSSSHPDRWWALQIPWGPLGTLERTRLLQECYSLELFQLSWYQSSGSEPHSNCEDVCKMNYVNWISFFL